MKKATKFLAFITVLATVISLLPTAASAQFSEKTKDYDDYGYYVYFDFENYGSSSSHEAYFEDDNSTNADGKLCDPFNNVNSETKKAGTGVIVEESGNRYYSYVSDGTSAEASMGVFKLADSKAGDLIIGEAVDISFRFRMHEGLGEDDGIPEGALMPLIHIRRGGEGNGVYLYSDALGNLYNNGKNLIYTNSSQSDFLNINLKWYDFSNVTDLYVNGEAVLEALPINMTDIKDYRTYTTTAFDDDFAVESISQATTAQRSVEICRTTSGIKNQKWAFDIDDIKIARIESAQRGAYCYENNFDSPENGIIKKSTSKNAYVYGSNYTAAHGTETVSGKSIGYISFSGNYFGLNDVYGKLSSGSFVTEFRIKGQTTHSSGLKPLMQFVLNGDANTNINNLQALFFDKDGNIYLENNTETIVNGFTLSESEWLDVAIVAVKNKANAGKFGQITDKNSSSSNMTYVFSYFINGVYVGSSSSMSFYEWNNGRTDSGYTYVTEKFTVDGTEVLPFDTSALTVVDSTTTANHVIYKSVKDGVPTYYDVETVDGVQKTYSVMTLTKSSYIDSLRFSSSSFTLKMDYLKVYEGTCPEWFYESLNSDKGGDIWNISFEKLGRTTKSNTAAMTDASGTEVSGTVYNSGFFTQTANQTANGSNVYFANGTYLDYYLPIPENDPSFVGEYSFEIELKNITNAAAKDGKWELALFNQRFENASGENRSTSSLMYVGDGTTVGDTRLYGVARTELYNADGSVATIDNTNGSKVRADLYVNSESGEYGVSYYLDGKPLYLADGSIAYRVKNSTVNSRFNEFFGKIQNYRTRLVQVTGYCNVDITSAKISMNERASYETLEKALGTGSVNALEFTLPKLAAENAYGAYVDALKLTKGTDSSLALLGVLTSTGELAVGSNGKYYNLCDKDKNLLTLSDTSDTKIAIVYDDINGDVRYYINSLPAYILIGGEAQTAADIALYDTSFASVENISEINCCLIAGLPSENIGAVSAFTTHKINDNDTAEIIGFQENSIVNGVRIIAGVDSLYYENVGFEVEIYENGVLKKSEDTSDNTVFSKIVADDHDITGEKYGYSYFTTVNIIELPQNIPDNSYILARSYATVAGVKHYDTRVKISVTADGYFIEDNPSEDDNTDDTEYFNKKQIVLLLGQSNMSGRGLAPYVEAISDDRITAYYDGIGWVTMSEPIHRDVTNVGIGLAASFAKAFVETYDCELGLVPLAKGGSSLSQWKKGFSGTDDTDLYETAVATAKEAMKTGEICAILWHQGESNRTTANYAEQFKEIMDGLITDIGLDKDKVAIITGELNSFGYESKRVDIVNAALNSTELTEYYTNYAVASADGLTNDELEDSHFDAPSLRVLGYRYFEGFYEAVMDKECPYEYSQNPLDYRVEPPVVEAENNSYYITEVDFNGYTEGATITGVKLPSSASISTGVDKYATLALTTSTDPYIDIECVPTVGKDIVVEVSFRVNDLEFVSATKANLLKLTPASGTSIVIVRLDDDGYIIDNESGERVGNPLSPDEWTTVKVVCHMADNTKDIYVYGTGYEDSLTGCTLHTSFNTAEFEIAKVRIAQFSNVANLNLDIDNFKFYERPVTPSEISDNIKLLGRAYALGTGLALDHSAAGFDFNFNGSGNIVLNITADADAKLCATVDGTTVKNISVSQGTSDILIAKELETGDHSVEIVSETGVSGTMTVNTVAFTGKLLEKTADTDTYIEFIGDSITAGYGLSATEGEHHDATLSYAYRTAKLLGSDYAIFAKSGMGIAYAEGGVNIFENRYKYQSYVRNTTDLYAPERTPDLVVINLAQNDNWQWYDNGGNKQSETYNNEYFDAKFGNMIDTVTGLYGKDVEILFVYGCMESSSFKPLATERSKYLIENVYTAAEGYNVTYTTLSTNREGKDNHPTAEGAAVQANELADYIFENYPEFSTAALENS